MEDLKEKRTGCQEIPKCEYLNFLQLMNPAVYSIKVNDSHENLQNSRDVGASCSELSAHSACDFNCLTAPGVSQQESKVKGSCY